MESGYRAYVSMYNEEFYVDTFTGEGFDDVIKKIDPLLSKYASKTYIPGQDFDDRKSELIIIAIEGIKAFDPSKNVKLSTFLHRHIHNKRVSIIKQKNKLSGDASMIKKEFDENSDVKIRKIREELAFSQFKIKRGSGDDSDGGRIEDMLCSKSKLYKSHRNKFDVDFKLSLEKIMPRLDKKTRKIVELVYYQGFSMTEAAKEVGLSNWAACLKLKKLSNKSYIRTIFGMEPCAINKNVNNGKE